MSAAAFSYAAEAHNHTVGGKDVTFTAWTETNSLPNKTGNYYLTYSVTLTETWTPADGVILDLNGKSITCTTAHAVISVYPDTSFTLTDCKGTGIITHDGDGQNSSGVSVAGGTFNMEGGSITGNSAGLSGGGGVWMHGGKFNMSGGSITDNTAANGGGVYVHGTFTVSGGVKISGNKNSVGSDSNVYLPSGKTITVTGALGGAEIGVTTKETPAGSPITIAEGGDGYTVMPDDAKVFFADDLGKYKTEFAEGVVRLSTGETQMVHPVCGMECTHMEDGNPKHPDVTWKPWSNATTLPNDNGNYYLTVDVTLRNTWSFDKDNGVALDLNGKTVSINASSHTIESCGNVALTDCRGGGKITHGSQKGLGVHVSGGTFDMYGGSITGNSSSNGGGGVYVSGGGTFNMNGGSIDNNNATSREHGQGGGVYMKNGTFNMYDGSISGNTATSYGGGVYVEHGKFNMEGGSIDNNYSEIYGGGVGMGGGTFHMKGGDISNNNAPHNGGVFVNGGEFNMSGTASIFGNEATESAGYNSQGGGVRVDKGTFHMSGGSITGNVCGRRRVPHERHSQHLRQQRPERRRRRICER